MRALGLDLGASKLQGMVVDVEGKEPRHRVDREPRREGEFAGRPGGSSPGRGMMEIHREKCVTRGDHPEAVIDQLVDFGGALLRDHAPIAAVGVGFPGLVAPDGSRVRSSVMLPGWSEVPLGERLQLAFDRPVFVDNDVKQAARAEARLRGPDADRDFLFVAVGSGIGGALVFGGEVHGGAANAAGEIGHVSLDPTGGERCACGRRGCVGLVAPGLKIEAECGLAPGELAAALDVGRPDVLQAVERGARALGAALASVQNVLAPSLVVLGGGLGRRDEYRRWTAAQAAAEAFPEIAESCRFEPARAGDEAGALGAALAAAQRNP